MYFVSIIILKIMGLFEASLWQMNQINFYKLHVVLCLGKWNIFAFVSALSKMRFKKISTKRLKNSYTLFALEISIEKILFLWKILQIYHFKEIDVKTLGFQVPYPKQHISYLLKVSISKKISKLFFKKSMHWARIYIGGIP